MKERIKQIRKKNKMTQVEFGEKVGVKGNTITNYETGLRKPTDAVVLSICREFNINEDWLRTGNGEMQRNIGDDDFSKISTIIGEKDPKARQAIITYWNLSDEDKKLFWQFADKFLTGIESTKELHIPSSDKEKSIDEMVEDYRKQLELEKKVKEKSEASQKSG